MKYRKHIFFVIFCFLVYNGSYMLLTWNSNQPSLDDQYEVRLFIDAGVPPPDWFLSVNLYDESGKLYDSATTTYYAKSSCYVAIFRLHMTIGFESWTIQNKIFTAFENGNESRVSFSFVVGDEWQAGNGTSWAQWYQPVKTDNYVVCVALGPYDVAPLITRYQLAELLNINFCAMIIGCVFVLGYSYGKEATK